MGDAVVDIIVALIGAAASIIAAIIITGKDRPPQERWSKEGIVKSVKKLSGAGRGFFLTVAASAAGAVVVLNLVKLVLNGQDYLKAPVEISGYFHPSGWMGDVKGIKLNDQWKENCHSDPTCIRITYEPSDKGWAGVYWQTPPTPTIPVNWGQAPGRIIKGATRVVFWARGDKGGELVEFKTGGLGTLDPSAKYRDSFERILGTKALKVEWERFEIDITGLDTTSVLGPFAWSASRNGNPDGLTFYLDDIRFEP